MPDPVVVAAAPDAPAPSPTPVATPPAAPAPEPKSNRKIAENLASLLTGTAPPVKPEAKPADEQKPAPAKPKPDEKPIKVKKAAVVKVEDVAPTVPKRDAPPPPEAPKPDSDEDFEKSLLEEERAQLDDAKAAEKYIPDKYKGHSSKLRSFLKENAAKSVAVEKGELDSADYKDWYEANRPKIGPLDFRAIERSRIKEEMTREFQPKIEEEKHERWVEAEAPKIRSRGDEIHTKLTNSALPEEVMTAISERTKGVTDRAEYVKRVNEVQENFKMEFEVADTVIKQATADLEEFFRLVTINQKTGKPVKPRNADPGSEEGKWHAQIANMAHAVGDEFKASGSPDLRRDGKWFATWREWNGMTPEQQAAWWTFSNDEVAERAMGKVKGIIAAEVKRRNDYLESRGWRRNSASAAAPATPPPAGAPPAPRSSPPPANSTAPVSVGSRLAAQLVG
jgi:hypothetical protein